MNVMTLVQWLLIVVVQWIYFVDANWITGNLCWSMPCMNGGSCFGSAYTYLCVCPVNYSGALCEKRLGICQENPCGNRGLCVETGLTSFECRCYFDYMGPLCEEHVPKNDASAWSSLLPAHTRVLFDILQEAYRTKAQGRSSNNFNSVQNDFSSSSTSTLASEILITSPIDTTKVEHVIPASAIQLENIFPETNIASESNTSTQISPITTELNDYIDETNFSLDTTTDALQTSTIENIITVSTEQYQTVDFNTTEAQQFDNTTESDSTTMTIQTTTTTTVSTQWTSYQFENVTDSLTTEMLSNNSTEQIIYTTDSEDIINSTSFEIMNSTDDYQYISSEQMVTSTSNPTEQIFTTENVFETTDISQNVQSQLLLKLCQQLIAHILPNISSSAAIETALNLMSSTASSDQNSTEALVSWLKEKLSTSESSSPPPTTTTTAAATTSTTKISTTSTTTTAFQSSLPSLLIEQKKLSLVPLQRVDMDDALYQMSDIVDSEN